MSWARRIWADRSRDYLRRTLMKQDEFDMLLIKRKWLEDKVRAFRFHSLVSGADSVQEASIREALSPVEPRVLLYGSSVAGTAFESGDADFAVVFPTAAPLHTEEPPMTLPETTDILSSVPLGSMGYVGGMTTFPRQAQPTVLNALYEHMQQHEGPRVPGDASHRLQRIFRARIPIMQFIPSLAELQERNHMGKTGECATSVQMEKLLVKASESEKREHYDISLSVDGARNSLLIRQYMMAYPALRVACLVLKQWGRKQKILNARRGWISPYALTIMLIHYVREANIVKDLIPPAAADVALLRASGIMCAESGPAAPEQKNGLSGKYGVEELDVILPMDFDNASAFEETADIVKGFFEYYGGVDGKFDFDTNVVDIRPEGRILSKDNWFSQDEASSLTDAEKWHRVGYGVLMIRDPYENHSLGRSVEFFRGESIREDMRVAAETGIDIETVLPQGP